MKIEHIAVWVNNLEQMKSFYEKYFGAVSSEKYLNPKTGFQSCFLSFEKDCRIELMFRPDILGQEKQYDAQKQGFIHLAFSVGSKEKVDEMTEKFRQDGINVVGKPRMTGDGYYESVILDPENNIIEITE